MILYLLCINTAVNMTKVEIKILQGSAVTQTVQGGLMIHYLVANFLQYTSAKNYENRLRHVKVISEDTVGSFLRHHVDLC